MRLGDAFRMRGLNRVHAGALTLDLALGGGYPKGRGGGLWPESSGKTTLTLHANRRGPSAAVGVAAFVDAKHRPLDRGCLMPLPWAVVTLKNLLVSQPEYGRDGAGIVDQLVRSEPPL